MFRDKRITWEKYKHFSTMYLIVNCKSFRESDGKKARGYERELILFVAEQGKEYVPFISKDKKNKLEIKKIAQKAFDKFSNFAEEGNSKSAREEIRIGVNAILKILLGDELFEILVKTYSNAFGVIENYLDELTKEEIELLSAVDMEIRACGVNIGLVKD